MTDRIDTAIVDGTCVTAEGMFEADLAIDDGRIVAVGNSRTFPDADEVVDAQDLLVMPGFVDPHVHIDDSASIDSYKTATGAAALGGITTVIDFAWQTENNVPDNESRPLIDGIRRKQEKASEAYVDYGFHGGLTVEELPIRSQIQDAVEAGVTSFKMFTAYDFGVSNGYIRQAMEHIADFDAIGVFHTEDNDVCESLVAEFKEEDRSEPTLYPCSRPDYAEAMAAEDILRLAKSTGAKYYGVHTSCRKSAEVFDEFIEDGSQIRAETCTHYTVLDEAVYENQGNLPLIAPPIRKSDDIEAIFEHLRSGVLTVVSTDHAPHYQEEKQTQWWDSPYGAGSLQVSVPVFHDAAVNERGFSYPFLVRTMSKNPAETFGLQDKGTLAPGTDADIVIFDPDEKFTISADDNVSKQDFNIYEDKEVRGQVTKTFVRGQLIAENGTLTDTSGIGEFVERNCPTWQV